jgi:hypothetical protein
MPYKERNLWLVVFHRNNSNSLPWSNIITTRTWWLIRQYLESSQFDADSYFAGQLRRENLYSSRILVRLN